jgi:hypothetical protein
MDLLSLESRSDGLSPRALLEREIEEAEGSSSVKMRLRDEGVCALVVAAGYESTVLARWVDGRNLCLNGTAPGRPVELGHDLEVVGADGRRTQCWMIGTRSWQVTPVVNYLRTAVQQAARVSLAIEDRLRSEERG